MQVKSKKQKIQFVCQSCGNVTPRWMGKCPDCNSWNSLIEELVVKSAATNRTSLRTANVPVNLSQISFHDQLRIQVQSQEFNRVLGGGIVPGSVVLVGGDPGIGKSTLMLQEAATIASKNFRVLYVTGEESEQQTKLRAQRLGIDSDYLYILAETDITNISAHIESLAAKLVIVDSIQTVYQSALESSPGSISQVRQCAHELTTGSSGPSVGGT